FFFSSRRRHTRFSRDWSSDVCSSDLKLWEFQTVPRPGEPFNETWGDGWENRSGTNMWAFAAPVDAARGIVYLPIAGPAPNYYGGGRPGANVFGNSIVAVEAGTGRYLWHSQRSEEHTSELQSRENLVCRLLL